MTYTTSNGMLILGIETSCDDTSVAVLRIDNDRPEVLASIVSSQFKIHAPHGGIVPVLAAREHEKNLPVVLESALLASGYALSAIDLIAVTAGPGLIMSLVQGVKFAKNLAQKNNKPIIGVNHMSGHIYSNWLEPVEAISFPALCLTVSGGHTELVLMHDHGKYEMIGRTLDDAAGEAFDKIARMLELGYPGGPAISREADKIKNAKIKVQNDNLKLKVKLPRPMLYSKDFNFSFAGLKTAVLYLVRDLKQPLDEVKAEIAHEAQEAIVDVLIYKTKKAAEKFQPKSILLAGGVAANKLLREKLQVTSYKLQTPFFVPAPEYTTDNAAMIAVAGYYEAKSYKLKTKNFPDVEADANWEIA